jgi:glutamate formiminotransferase/glutamate formiminotransferase/formiminotetrahydrofolate cyclodeaminase
MALAVPNFSEGRDRKTIEAITAAFGGTAQVLDRHTDAVHDRSVLTLAAPPRELIGALVDGAAACIERIDMTGPRGEHPCIGALDVCPVVFATEPERGPARELALETARAVGELAVPVFLYGELATDPCRAERAYFRRGGLARLRERMAAGELAPDFGPGAPHPTAGATLVTARPPLAAFNVELDTADVEVARAVAAKLREAGDGIEGVRAIGVDLGDRAQVSTNVHDPATVPLAVVIERVRELAAAKGARPVAGEVVGLVPEAALHGLPGDVPLRGFDPDRQVIERRLGADGS